jgi:tripartite-type tricarboxylate transporter receptor subunit TctC
MEEARMLITRRTLLKGVAAVAAAAPGAPAFAQASFPSRPVKWICFQAPGGSMDLTMRAAQPSLEAAGLKTQLTYVQGASGNIARTQLYTSPPDGYTLTVDTNPSEVLNEFVPGAAFKISETEPVYGWDVEGYQLCVKKGSTIRTFKDLLEFSKTRPVKIATIGRGGSSHLQLLVLKQATGINMELVHFSGSAQCYPQVIGGNVDAAIGGPASGVQAADQLQFLCVFRAEGEPALPDVPTLKAQGFDVQQVDQVWYTYAPPKTPEDRLAKLESIFAAAMHMPACAEAQGHAGFTQLTFLSRSDLRAVRERSYKLAMEFRDDLQVK